MKLVKLHLKGFRGFAEEITVKFDDLTVFIGKNDAGKSSIFDALNIFFGESKMDMGDLNTGLNISSLVTISCEFTNYPDELVIDTSHKILPKDEYLLNAAGNIQIKKVYVGKTLIPKTYLVATHPAEESLNDLLELSIGDLRKRSQEIGVDLSNINKAVKADIRHAMWNSRNAGGHLEEKDIPIDKNAKGEFKVIERQLQEHMPIFALFKSDRPNIDQDPEAQDPLKLAVKEIIAERKSELDTIASTIRGKLQQIANKTVEKIREMDVEIAGQLSPNVSDPAWDKVFKISLTSENEVPVNKRGSGFRRLVLLNFFRVKAEEKAEGKDVIYAIEEPETSQHPNNQRMLIKAFEDLAYRDNCQVFATTHTPMLASLISDKHLRYVKIANGNRNIFDSLSETDKKEIVNSLGILPDNNVKLFLFVEGDNDINFLIRMAKKFSIDLSEAKNKGELIFIPMGGSNLQFWVSKLENLNKMEIYIYDRDDANRNRDEEERNKKIFQTSKREMENYIHPKAIVEAYEDENIEITVNLEEVRDESDIPVLIAEKVHNATSDHENWDKLKEKKKKKKESQAKKMLNTSAVEKMTENQLQEIGGWDEIEKWMSAIRNALDVA